jgi:hypothetical protein
METVIITISPVQLVTLKAVLKFEIATEGKGRMIRESALSAYKRLIAEPAGIKAGRGQKGRIEALEIVEELLAQVEGQNILPQNR